MTSGAGKLGKYLRDKLAASVSPAQSDARGSSSHGNGVDPDSSAFRAIFEQALVGIAHMAPDGHVLAVNRRLRELLDLSDEQLAQVLRGLLERVGRERPVERAAPHSGESSARKLEESHDRRDGSRIWIEVACSELRAAGGRAGRILVVHDVTESKRLREADRRKDEFLAMLAHELRNPLAPIHAAVQVLHQSALAEPQLGLARDMIDRQLRLLTRLVDDLLDVARITRGAIPLHREKVALRAVATAAIESSRHLIDAKRQTLAVDLGLAPIVLDGDPARLTQVITNLLNNAAKYTREGGHIALAAELTGDQICLRVRDDGAGMSPELIERAFELFAQGDPTLARSASGLGIGLTLVRRLVEMHGGSVAAHSDGPNLGSEFVVRLPIAAAGAEAVEPRAAAPQPVPAPRATISLRVLVVDDNEDAADSLELLLSAWKHEVRVAHDGPQAIAAAVAFKPQLALLDIGLPEMSGYELAQHLRALPELQPLRLVALSGYSRDSDRKQAEQAGFQHYLVKPPDLAALRKILADV